MAEGDIRRAVQNRCSGLIEHGSRRLLHVARLLILSASVGVAALHPGDIEPLGGAGLVPREVVSLQKDGIEYWMIRVYACVNDGDNSFAGYAKAVLCVREADDLGSRLGRITVPNDRAVILDWRRIVQPGWDTWELLLWNREKPVGFNTDDTEERFSECQGTGYEVPYRGYQKCLSDRAVQAALNLATEK